MTWETRSRESISPCLTRARLRRISGSENEEQNAEEQSAIDYFLEH